jgi:hypothetical protein
VMQACAGSLVKRGGGTGFLSLMYACICIYIYTFYGITHQMMVYIYMHMILNLYFMIRRTQY